MRGLIVLLMLCGQAFAQELSAFAWLDTPTPESRLPWAETDSDEFRFGGSDLLAHIKEHGLMREVRQLHEWHHRQIEAVRPVGHSEYIAVEYSDADFARWTERKALESIGWKIVRMPVREEPVSFVVLGKSHYSQRGLLTIANLNRFKTQSNNRKTPAVKSGKARWAAITKITMFTRANCPPCDQWKRNEMPQAKADGIEVVLINDGGTAPRFEVCTENNCRNYVGYVSYSKMKADAQ